jgi:glyoxylase-like metal-dependent hydrolase (beta-lactamase superfamily II)
LSLDHTIISIGAMACNLQWQETKPVRTQHATTTLIVDAERRILVDPSLPGEILTARLHERTGLRAEDITDVFCTTLHPSFRRGISAFEQARWFADETELQWYASQLETACETADRLESEDAANVQAELETLQQFKPAPDKFTSAVGIYPLHGATPGCCGLLLTPPTQTLLVAGPAVPTRGYLQAGMIWQDSTDRQAAMDALQDVLEIAEVIVPGFDNITFIPGRWM